jgi:hypothetical protein
MMMHKGSAYFFNVFWAYTLLPIAGAGIALVFYELVFKKTQ